VIQSEPESEAEGANRDEKSGWKNMFKKTQQGPVDFSCYTNQLPK
jgi:hypothetical protein